MACTWPRLPISLTGSSFWIGSSGSCPVDVHSFVLLLFPSLTYHSHFRPPSSIPPSSAVAASNSPLVSFTRPCSPLHLLFLLAARTDRYNHDLETDDDDDDDDDDSLEFSNFSTCSPRYSRILSPGPVSPLSCDEKKDESNKSTSEPDNQSSESSPPTVRRRSLKKKVSDFSDELSESRESDEEQPRRRSDSGISRDWKRQTSSSSSTPEYVCFIFSHLRVREDSCHIFIV